MGRRIQSLLILIFALCLFQTATANELLGRPFADEELGLFEMRDPMGARVSRLFLLKEKGLDVLGPNGFSDRRMRLSLDEEGRYFASRADLWSFLIYHANEVRPYLVTHDPYQGMRQRVISFEDPTLLPVSTRKLVREEERFEDKLEVLRDSEAYQDDLRSWLQPVLERSLQLELDFDAFSKAVEIDWELYRSSDAGIQDGDPEEVARDLNRELLGTNIKFYEEGGELRGRIEVPNPGDEGSALQNMHRALSPLEMSEYATSDQDMYSSMEQHLSTDDGFAKKNAKKFLEESMFRAEVGVTIAILSQLEGALVRALDASRQAGVDASSSLFTRMENARIQSAKLLTGWEKMSKSAQRMTKFRSAFPNFWFLSYVRPNDPLLASVGRYEGMKPINSAKTHMFKHALRTVAVVAIAAAVVVDVVEAVQAKNADLPKDEVSRRAWKAVGDALVLGLCAVPNPVGLSWGLVNLATNVAHEVNVNAPTSDDISATFAELFSDTALTGEKIVKEGFQGRNLAMENFQRLREGKRVLDLEAEKRLEAWNENQGRNDDTDPPIVFSLSPEGYAETMDLALERFEERYGPRETLSIENQMMLERSLSKVTEVFAQAYLGLALKMEQDLGWRNHNLLLASVDDHPLSMMWKIPVLLGGILGRKMGTHDEKSFDRILNMVFWQRAEDQHDRKNRREVQRHFMDEMDRFFQKVEEKRRIFQVEGPRTLAMQDGLLYEIELKIQALESGAIENEFGIMRRPEESPELSEADRRLIDALKDVRSALRKLSLG